MEKTARNTAIAMPRGFLSVPRLTTQLIIFVIFSVVLAEAPEHLYTKISETDMPVDYESYSTYSIEHLLKTEDQFDFDPVALERRLIKSAAAHFTLPTEFQKELKRLVPANYFTDETRELERKYNITAKPKFLDQETITYERLALMYPQYTNLYSVSSVDRAEIRCPLLYSVVPPIMRTPEFGGLIPTLNGRVLDKRQLKHLVLVHLAWLTCNSEESSTMKDLGTQLLKRMKLSRMPDGMRLDLLREKGIIKKDGTLEDVYSIKHEHIPQIIADKLFAELG